MQLKTRIKFYQVTADSKIADLDNPTLRTDSRTSEDKETKEV